MSLEERASKSARSIALAVVMSVNLFSHQGSFGADMSMILITMVFVGVPIVFGVYNAIMALGASHECACESEDTVVTEKA